MTAVQRLIDNVQQVIFGKEETVRLAVTALLARGHVLIEDAPGLGKTMLARALAQSIDATFKRIQFTPDMLPTDVTGVSIYNPSHEKFEYQPGPVFADVVLADEINRTSPRTQAALLEAMEERQISVEGRPLPLPELFFVVATQNPIELEGTFPLPEAQIDRFLMKIEIGYPAPEEERRILVAQLESHPIETLAPVATSREVLDLQAQVRAIPIRPEIQDYIVAIANRTRAHPAVRLGVSPRGSLALSRAAQAHALVGGESFVTPDGVKAVASAVLGHRLVLDPHREYAGLSRRELIAEILDDVEVPVDGSTDDSAEGSRGKSSGA